MQDSLIEYIEKRKRELNAVIMAHFYQSPEIQDIADFVGDSLELARLAAESDADVIVICGVHFMAESAKILNPGKKVLIPVPDAGCPMADMVQAGDLKTRKAEMPDALVVSYVNTSAAVKAESYICCTSSNALKVVQSLPENCPILFVPDRNLGSYIISQTGRDMHLWDGCCPIHDALGIEELEAVASKYPHAPIVVHPECRPEICRRANAVRSTGGIREYIVNSPDKEFIVGTEDGFFHALQKIRPDAVYHRTRTGFVCEDMKKIGIRELAECLEKEQHEIMVPEEVLVRARQALERMLAIK